MCCYFKFWHHPKAMWLLRYIIVLCHSMVVFLLCISVSREIIVVKENHRSPMDSSQKGPVNKQNPWQRCLISLQWHHDGCDGVSNHQPHDCLLNRLFRHRSKKISKLRVTGLCQENSPVTGNAENYSFWWRYHDVVDVIYSETCL